MRYICHAYGWRTLWGALAWKWQKVRKEPRYSRITHFLLRRRKKGTKLLCRANAWKNFFLFSNILRSSAFDLRCALKYVLFIQGPFEWEYLWKRSQRLVSPNKAIQRWGHIKTGPSIQIGGWSIQSWWNICLEIIRNCGNTLGSNSQVAY